MSTCAPASVREADPTRPEAERRRLIEHWDASPDLKRTVVQQVLAEAQRRRLGAAITEQRRTIAAYYGRHGEAGGDAAHGGGAHAFVGVRAWGAGGAPAHGLDPAAPAVHLAKDDPLGLSKTVLGETTTRLEKARAFNHYVSTVRRQGPMRVLYVGRCPAARPGGAEGGEDAPGAGCAELRDPGPAPLPRADVLLSCVHAQWRELAVWAHPVSGGLATRVEGKQRREEGDGRGAAHQRDDAWMAFGIGLQWCTRFTALLGDPLDRALLLDYMRKLEGEMAQAMRENLREADREAAEPTRDGSGEAPAAPPPSSEPPLPRAIAADATPVRPEVRDALAVCTATLHGVRRCCASLLVALRRLLLSFIAHGFVMRGTGYTLAVYRVAHRSHVSDQKRWQELTTREILASGGTLPVDVAALRRTFGRSVDIVRFVCATGPGPRHAWPGTGTLPDGTGGDRRRRRRRRCAPPTDEGEDVAAVEHHLRVLLRVAAWTERTHAPHHPVFGASTDAARLLRLLVTRILHTVADVRASLDNEDVVPGVVRGTYTAATVSELNARLGAGGGAAAPPHPRRVPALVVAAHGLVGDDLRLLRRLEEHGRRRLVALAEASSPRPAPHLARHTRWDVDVPPAVAPSLSVRMVSRPNLNWQHVFRGLFPAQHREHRRAAEEAPPTVVGYQSRLLFVGDE